MVIVKVKTEHTIFSWNSVPSRHMFYFASYDYAYIQSVYTCTVADSTVV
jgi:hypothetical protein